MADANASELLNQAASQVATTQNIDFAVQTGENLFSLAIKLVSDTISLVTTNFWWGIAIIALVLAENALVDQFRIPLLIQIKGKLRYALLFFGTMFFAWFWQPIIAGWIH